MHIYQGLQDKDNLQPFLDPDEFSSFFNWPGDRPSLEGGGDKEKNATEHSTTQKGNVNVAENVAESTRAVEPSTRARDEPEPEPLKTQYIISSNDDEEDQMGREYENDPDVDDYDDFFPDD